MNPTSVSLPELVSGGPLPSPLAFEEVARLTRKGRTFRVDASEDQFRLAIEDAGTGALKIRVAQDWRTLLILLIEVEAELVFIRLCIAFLSTWKMTARIGAEKES